MVSVVVQVIPSVVPQPAAEAAMEAAFEAGGGEAGGVELEKDGGEAAYDVRDAVALEESDKQDGERAAVVPVWPQPAVRVGGRVEQSTGGPLTVGLVVG